MEARRALFCDGIIDTGYSQKLRALCARVAHPTQQEVDLASLSSSTD